MKNPELKELEAKIKQIERTVKGIMPRAATIAVNFFKDRFVAQNWVSDRTEPWRPRKEDRSRRRSNRRQRAILVKTGRLKRSIRKIWVTESAALIGTDVPYARAHNEGFKGIVQVKQYERKVTRRIGYVNDYGEKEDSKVEYDTTVKAHSMKMNLPRRQFMGPSPYLSKKIERMMQVEFNKALK